MTPRSLSTTSEASNLLPFFEVKPFRLTFRPASSRRSTVPSAAEREALGEAVVSVSAALCEAGLPHQAAWLDRETMEPQLCAIGSMEELTQALSGLLSAETEPDEQTVTQRLAEEQGLDYAHVVALSLRPEEDELYTASGAPVAHLTVSEDVLKSKEGIYLAL